MTDWIVQLAFPWMISDPEEPAKEEVRIKAVPRWPKGAALALAEILLREVGTEAKCRVTNPVTGEFIALVIDENGEIKDFHGRDERKET